MTQFTKEAMAARYHELCAQRDAVNAKTAPLQAELDAANAAAQEASNKAAAIAAQIQAARGGSAWVDMKKEIGLIATALKTIPPRAATE